MDTARRWDNFQKYSHTNIFLSNVIRDNQIKVQNKNKCNLHLKKWLLKQHLTTSTYRSFEKRG